MNITRPELFWQRWKRGFITLSTVSFVSVMPALLGLRILSLLEPGPTARIVIGLLFFVALVIAAPLLISTTGINAQAAREQLASAIQPQIDQLAMQAGLSWDGHYLSEVDQLLRQGQISQARKLYHDKASATWDEADQALGDWAGTVLIKKLEILRAQFHRSQNQGGAE